ncbi:MAG: hypothetical protein AAF916_01475 [Planctomycetota bacterium]
MFTATSRAQPANDASRDSYRIAVLHDNLPGLERDLVDQTIGQLNQAGFRVSGLTASRLADRTGLSHERFDALLLTHSPVFPASAIKNVHRFLRDGGDLVLLGGTGFETLVTQRRGTWLDAEDMATELANGRGLGPVSLFEKLDLKAWKHQAANRKANSTITEIRYRRHRALRLSLDDVTHYATYRAKLPDPIPDQHNAMLLWAKATSPQTRQAAFELRTQTGARWIATVDLDTSWQSILLQPSDFVYHEGGGDGDSQVLRISDAVSLSFGLAKSFGNFAGDDHTLMFTVAGTLELDLADGAILSRLNLFNEYEPFQYRDAVGSRTTAAAETWLKQPLHIVESLAGTAAFSVPRAGQSQAYPLVQTPNAQGQSVTSVAAVVNYAGEYAGSQWLISGVVSPSFYRTDAWRRLLVAGLDRMARQSWLTEAADQNALDHVDQMRDVIGVTHAGAKYHFTDRGVLNEGADAIAELGTRTIKLWMPRPKELYRFNHDWPDELNALVDVAKLPAWQEVLAGPFDTYYLEAFALPRQFGVMRGGVDSEEARWITEQFADLTRHLLTEYRGTGKTFVLQNWEGDWALRPAMDRDLEPSDEKLKAMIAWLNARQAGVDQARNEVGEDGVRVLHAAESNLVLQQMQDGRAGVIRDVISHTNVDLVSYSCYDTRGNPKGFRAAMEYIAMHLPPTTRFDLPNRVVIGEIGVPETQMGEAAVQRMLPEQTEIALAYGTPHILYWALYCNELRGDPPIPVQQNEQVNGFWLIKPDGTRAWAWHYLSSLLSSED